ncbi:hypothetical protein O181_085190 [Austropuccinia psidii MF-1]|uniref:Integrase zinc-binding domain-containing protein n=1 Tax=Austropuccinia psidii MF-1 TaxID=1389203 RepID=A0A9Q3FRP9_9BASI|nr:hypothetical protein [Austropuccinia psidii MF-1]
MKKPQSSQDEEFRRIKRRSSNIFLEDGQLKRRNNPNPQLVISSKEVQRYILKSLHEDIGHRGENETYRRIKARFWWEGMKKSVKKWVQSCLACQKRSQNLQREQGKSTATSKIFERVSMDAVHIKSGRWKTTGFSPYELQFGKLPVLPIDIETKTFSAVEWHKISTTEELMEARAKQLEGKEEMRRKGVEKLKKSKEDSMKYWDRRMEHQLRSPLNPGDLVLVYNKAIETNWGLLFKNKWNGPYRVIRQTNNAPYELEELDGTELARRLAASQVKRFYPRGKLMKHKRRNRRRAK